MRATDRKRIRRIIDAWAPVLGLSEWVITISNEQPPYAERLAQVTQKRDLRVAELRLRSDVLTVPALENICILHELLHITPLFDQWDDQLNDNALLEREQRHLLETILDDVARWILVASGANFPVPAVA